MHVLLSYLYIFFKTDVFSLWKQDQSASSKSQFNCKCLPNVTTRWSQSYSKYKLFCRELKKWFCWRDNRLKINKLVFQLIFLLKNSFCCASFSQISLKKCKNCILTFLITTFLQTALETVNLYWTNISRVRLKTPNTHLLLWHLSILVHVQRAKEVLRWAVQPHEQVTGGHSLLEAH